MGAPYIYDISRLRVKSESWGRGGARHADDEILLRTVHIF